MAKMDFAAAVKSLLDSARQTTQEVGSKHGISGSKGSKDKADGQGGSNPAGDGDEAISQTGSGGAVPNGTESSIPPANPAITTMLPTPAARESSDAALPGGQPENPESEPMNPFESIIGFFTGGKAAADEGADAVGYYDSGGTVAAEGDNDYIATVDSQIQDAIDNGQMLNGVDLDEYDINPDDVNWTSIAWMPAGENVYGKIYGTETVYDADGNEYTVLSDAANEARANDLFYLYSLEGNQEIFGDNWTTDRAAFQQHYDNAISTDELLSNFDEYGYQYAFGDDQAISELAAMIAASGVPYYLGSNDTYNMQEMYQDDPAAYVDNIEAILAQGAMESAGLGDIVDYMNGAYEGDLTIDELQQQAADRLGWREDDLNALTSNENIEYGTGDGWGRNTTAHRGDPIADQYDSSLDDEWLRRSAENPTWNSREYEAPLPVQNMSDNVFAIFDGMSY